MKNIYKVIKKVKQIYCYCIILIFLQSSLSSAQTVTATNDLLFGNNYPGVPKNISKSSATSAAEFTVAGVEGDEVSLVFDLPSYLSATGASMPVFFSNTSCAVDTTNPRDQGSPSADDLNPNGTISYRFGSTGMTVWLGGTIVPGLVQKAGNYSATIRLTATLTGN